MALGFSFGTGDDYLAGSAYIVSCMITMLCFAFPGCQESDLAFGNPCHVEACRALHTDRGCPASLLLTVPLLWATLLRCQEGTSVGKLQTGALQTVFHFLFQNVEAFSFLPSICCYIFFEKVSLQSNILKALNLRSSRCCSGGPETWRQ